MHKHWLALSAFAFAAAAGTLIATVPWPIAGLSDIALGIAFAAILSIRDAEIVDALGAEGDAR